MEKQSLKNFQNALKDIILKCLKCRESFNLRALKPYTFRCKWRYYRYEFSASIGTVFSKKRFTCILYDCKTTRLKFYQ